MSYDLSIRSSTPNVFVRKMELTNHLLELGLVADSDNHFLFQESGKNYADMDLAWCRDGSWEQPLDTVNCMQVHIPYGYVESMLDKIVMDCKRIAERLDWRLYDEQEGKYLR
jgi:hypothetical protein